MKYPYILFLGLLALLGACAHSGTGGDPSSVRVPMEQAALPPGMRLGAEYTSALNEQCYGVYQVDGPAVQAHVLCWREKSWELLPPMYMIVPASGADGPRRP